METLYNSNRAISVQNDRNYGLQLQLTENQGMLNDWSKVVREIICPKTPSPFIELQPLSPTTNCNNSSSTLVWRQTIRSSSALNSSGRWAGGADVRVKKYYVRSQSTDIFARVRYTARVDVSKKIKNVRFLLLPFNRSSLHVANSKCVRDFAAFFDLFS